jgi:hypothetical protein
MVSDVEWLCEVTEQSIKNPPCETFSHSVNQLFAI